MSTIVPNRQSFHRFVLFLALTLLGFGGGIFAAQTDHPDLTVELLKPVITVHPIQMLENFLKDLNLTTDQREQIRDVLKNHRAPLNAIAAAQIVARKELNQSIHKTGYNEAAVRIASALVAAADLDLARERARIFSEIYPILTPEQRGKIQLASETFISALEGWMTGKCGQGTLFTNPLSQAILDRVADRLDLTDAQRARIKGILEAEKGTLCGILQNEWAARKVLRTAIQKPVPDMAAVTVASRNVAQIDLSLSLERARLFSEVSAVLTTEQKDRIRDLAEKVQNVVISLFELLKDRGWPTMF